MKTIKPLVGRLLVLAFATVTLSSVRGDLGCHLEGTDLPYNVYTTACSGAGSCTQTEWYPATMTCYYTSASGIYCTRRDEYGAFCYYPGWAVITYGTCDTRPDGSWYCHLGNYYRVVDANIMYPCTEGIDYDMCP